MRGMDSLRQVVRYSLAAVVWVSLGAFVVVMALAMASALLGQQP